MLKIALAAAVAAAAVPVTANVIYASASGTVAGSFSSTAGGPCAVTLDPPIEVAPTTGNQASVLAGDSSAYRRLAIFEFDLDRWRASGTNDRSFLNLAAQALRGAVDYSIPLCITAYDGDGMITAADANVTGSVLGPANVQGRDFQRPPHYPTTYVSLDITDLVRSLPTSQSYIGFQFGVALAEAVELRDVRLSSYADVPEPGVFGLFGLGVAGLALARRRRS